ncbi:MAG TPA: hypothetical protein VLY04_16075 [Bryobacteraceae bacterium]|nr:hypothetical protein [Bryobacteraceae bacterium]
MKRILVLVIPAAAVSLGLILAQPTAAPRLNSDLVRDLAMRNIAGTFSSGRIADVAVDPKNRDVWYVASASGGLWKTTNRGISFQPIFDDGGSYSLGCVTVDPENSDVVWLGTGENQAQRAIGYGDGIYKSTDAGRTWTNMGLRNSEHIAKILIDPRDSNMVLVASQGPLFSAGGDRGLYRTGDGGQTWKPILQITENTGITDIDIDPRNPDVIYAAAYQRRRNTSVIVAGGPDAGIFKTTDGGAHWTRLKEGLPAVDMGRIALAISPQKPDVVYAFIMTARGNQQSGFYRSEDAGAHWTKGAVFEVQDPEYYGEIFADPFQFDRVYGMDVNVFVTEDGGKTVTRAGWSVHSDNHALAFDPTDLNHLIEGNDGGLYESYDHGHSWRHFNNIPVTQFYRVSVDNGLPFYNVYGGTQDNGSQGVPSRTVNRAGIRTSDWMSTGGGDGYQSRADPEDPNIVYACSQQINCVRLDLKTGISTSINPRPGRGGRGAPPAPQPGKVDDPKLRDRWDIPFIISPHNHTRLYMAGNRLMRSDDSGATWKLVSPDLTRNIDRDTIPVMGKVWGTEAVWKNAFTDEYGTGTALAESPLKEGLLFVGTDDGLLQISEDGAETWRKIDKWPDVPDLTYVTDVHPSPTDVNTVYVTLNDFQRGNFKPYVMKSPDLGRTWTSISGDLPERDPAWTIVQDYVNPNLLFVGTEFGLSFTVDGGKQWVKIKGGMPTITIRDLEIQKRENDLAAASFGRGFFILDDYSALRQITPEALASEGALFAPGRKARLYEEIGYYRAQGDNLAVPNPPFGALLTYYLRDNLAGGVPDAPKMVLEIDDGTGKMVRQIDASSKAGVHRAVWDLRESGPPPAPQGRGTSPGGGQPEQAAGRGGRGGRGGPLVKAGTYTITLGKLVNGALTPVGQSQKLEVAPLEASNR